MRLDPRLSLAFNLYDECPLAADIGTDHALLPIALLRSGRCDRMILTDISPDALANARAHLSAAGLTDRAELRLGDGLQTIRESCGMISLLGLGGRTIAEILTSCPENLRGAALLLSAHTDQPLVRRAVADIGYHLVSETPVLDTGRYYIMMKARPGSENMTPREIRLGKKLFESSSPDLSPYLAHRIRVLEAKRAGLRRASAREEAQIRELEEDLEYLRTVLL